MHKAGCIGIDFHPRLYEASEIGLCKSIDHFLIRNSGYDQFDIYPLPRRGRDCRNHHIIQYQVRCHDMYILFSPVQEVYVNGLSDFILVQRVVSIRHDIAGQTLRARVCSLIRLSYRVRFLVRFSPDNWIPVFRIFTFRRQPVIYKPL